MEIEHSAIVLSVNEDTVTVTIQRQSACASCKNKKSCTIFGNTEKTITIRTDEAQKYKPGQKVTVTMEEKAGWMAVFWGYLLPLLVLVLALFLTTELTGNEPIAATISLSTVAIYYFILFLNRNKVKKYFVFRIKYASVPEN